MQKGKKFVWNTLCATGVWILYNTFFLYVHILYDFSTIKWEFGMEPMPVFYDTVVPIIMLFLYVLSFVGFFFLGKTKLAVTRSHVLNLVSVVLGYMILWAFVGLVFDSEHTSMIMTNFPIICVADAFDSKSIYDLHYDVQANACVMAIPFVCMYIGLTVRQIIENKANRSNGDG